MWKVQLGLECAESHSLRTALLILLATAVNLTLSSGLAKNP